MSKVIQLFSLENIFCLSVDVLACGLLSAERMTGKLKEIAWQDSLSHLTSCTIIASLPFHLDIPVFLYYQLTKSKD